MTGKFTGVLAVSLSIVSLFGSSAAIAQPEAAMEAARRVNIAGRQRMLSQRISRFSCYVYAGIDPEEHMGRLQDAKELFETSQLALRHGNTEMKLPPEENFLVREELNTVNDHWQKFVVHLNEAIEMNTVDEESIHHIDIDGLILLEKGDSLVRRISRVYGEQLPDISIIMGVTMDLAGRQRMLTQKAAKEGCLIEAGVNVEENRQRLAETIRVFSGTLDALISGFPGMVLPAPTPEIESGLIALKANWVGAHDVFALLADGQPITDGQRSLIDAGMEQMLHDMNEVVKLYEHAAGMEIHGGLPGRDGN
jgi:hypothetical protein